MTRADAPRGAQEELAEALHAQTRTLLEELLDGVSADSLFATVQASALHTVLGVALAYALLWRLEGDREHRAQALELSGRYLQVRGRPRTYPRALARLRTASRWNAREAIEAGSTLGWIALALAPSLSADEEGALVRTVLATRPALRASGSLGYYINGNYAIPLCELAYLWRCLGPEAEGDDYEGCWQLLVNPASVSPRWEGYGWVMTEPPSADGRSAGAGYFSETRGYVGRRPQRTFDAEYSQLQTERLTRLWLLNGDRRALEHLRALHSTLLDHLDRERWTISTRGATRVSGSTVFCNPASSLLALFSPQQEVSVEFAGEQFEGAVLAEYRRAKWAANPYLIRGVGTIIAPLLLMTAPTNAAWNAPVAPLSDSRRLFTPGADAGAALG